MPPSVCNRTSGAVRWVHIPKAGSSFATTIWAYGCPALPLSLTSRLKLNKNNNITEIKAIGQAQRKDKCPCLIGTVEYTFHHGALPLEQVAKAVCIFREPISRLVSAFHFNLHIHRMVASTHLRLRKEIDALLATGNRTAALLRFARVPGVLHTQTRMVMNRQPMDHQDKVPSARLTALACERVRKMRFVGLIECFAESVALFRRGFPAGYAADQTRYRVGSDPEQHALDLQLIRAQGLHDKQDETVYRVAATRFQADLRPSAIVPQSDGQCAHALATNGHRQK